MIIIYVNYQKWHVCIESRPADLADTREPTNRDTREPTHMCTTHVHESAIYDDEALLIK